MNKKPINVLLVENDDFYVEIIRCAFENQPINSNLTVVTTLAEARTFILKRVPDMVIVDSVLPEGKGIELIQEGGSKDPYPVIIISDVPDIASAVNSVKAGAFDYINKSTSSLGDLPIICEKAFLEKGRIVKPEVIEDELQQRVSELSALNSLMQQVNDNLSLDQVVQSALKGIATAVAPDIAMIFLLNGTDLVLQGAHASDPKYKHEAAKLHKVGECLCGEAVKKGEPLYSINIHKDKRCTWDECKMAGLLSFSAIPLLKDGKIIGLLGLASGEKLRDFGKQAHFLETLSNGIAIGLQNALLFEEANASRAKIVKTNKKLKKEIIERAKTENACKETNRLLEGTFLSIKELVMVVDPNTRNIISCNKAVEDTFGYKIDEVVGRNSEFLYVNREMYESFGKKLYAALDDSGVFHTEFRMKRKDGNIIATEHTVNEMKTDEGERYAVVSVIRDITDYKKAEDALLKSEAGLAEAQRLAKLGNWDWNILNNDLYWSNEVYCIFGLSPLSFKPTREEVFRAVHSQDREFVKQSIDRALYEGMPYDIDYRIVLPDNRERIVHAQAEVTFNDKAKAIRMMGTVQDITDRKQAEEALKIKNSFLRLLKVAAVAANGAAEIEDAFKPILNEVCRHTGWPIGHAYITSSENTDLLEPSTIWHLENAERFIDFKRATDNTEFVKGVGLPGSVLASGKPQWIRDVTKISNFPRIEVAKEEGIKSAFAFPVLIGTDVVAVLEFFSTDAVSTDKNFLEIIADVGTELGRVVERKKAEENTRYLRNLLKNVIDSMPSVIVSVDYNGLVMQWNREAEKRTGVPMEKASGCKLSEVFAQPTIEIEKVRQVISSRTPSKDENIPGKNNSETQFCDVTIYPLIANGVEGAVIRIDDVTERVRIEEMMIQSEKMLSVGGLAAGMAHEINNPLAGILQSIQVVLDRTQADLPSNKKVADECGTTFEIIKSYMVNRDIIGMIEAIRASGQRAAKIVNNMLNFSRKSVSDFRPHDLCELLDRTLELACNEYDLKKRFDFRQIVIEKQYESGLPAVQCEDTKIQQVILNLLKNGAQAMADYESGKEEPKFVIRILQDRESVRIEVEDNGPGMDVATRKRVFEPFFSTKDVGVGTGLGLSVSYFIIAENHGGSMAVESEPGKGAKFIIRLPIEMKV